MGESGERGTYELFHPPDGIVRDDPFRETLDAAFDRFHIRDDGRTGFGRAYGLTRARVEVSMTECE